MQGNNPMNFLMQMMGMGNNPQQIIDGMVKQNPQMSVIMNQMKSSGMNPKDFVIQYAKQNNIDVGPLVNMMGQRGIKL